LFWVCIAIALIVKNRVLGPRSARGIDIGASALFVVWAGAIAYHWSTLLHRIGGS
jgi:hypothetical protein